VLDINVAQWLDGPERDEMVSVDAERRNQSIAAALGQPCLPTASLNWEAAFVSGSPPGALTVVNARETLTTVANRRRWARQKALRSGPAALLAALRATPLSS
jgi:hypothetical protein